LIAVMTSVLERRFADRVGRDMAWTR
jgi:hypothetical protein